MAEEKKSEEVAECPATVTLDQSQNISVNFSNIPLQIRNGKLVCLRPDDLQQNFGKAMLALQTIVNDKCSYHSLKILRHYFESKSENGSIVASSIFDNFDFSSHPTPKLLCHVYSHYGWLEGLQYLTDELHCDISLRAKKGGFYCTHFAAFYGHYHVLNYILSKAVLSTDIINNYGEDSRAAAINGFKECFQGWTEFLQTITQQNKQLSLDRGELHNCRIMNVGSGLQLKRQFWDRARIEMDWDGSNKIHVTRNEGSAADLFYIWTIDNDGIKHFLTVDGVTNDNPSISGDINTHKLVLKPLNKDSIAQLWNITNVDCNIDDYDFGVANYHRLIRDSQFNNHPLLQQSDRNHQRIQRLENYRFIHRYYRISPVCFGDKYELCVTTEAIPAMVNEDRIWCRKGCLILRKKVRSDIVGYESSLNGRFVFIKEKCVSKSPPFVPLRFSHFFSQYSRVITVISNYSHN